jgi:nicotinamide-nucleotide amidase
VAGPGGGTVEKPVGTVWISIQGDGCHEARRFQFEGQRERIIAATSQTALDWLRRSLV